MNIAIIGAGNIGHALAGSAVRAGHRVTISSNDPEDAATTAQATGARAAPSNTAAVADAELVVLAVPYPALAPLVRDLGDALAGKVVIDPSNPVKPDLSGLAVEGASAAEEIQAIAADARVVKAFNTTLAARITQPRVEGTQLDGFVAGDDEGARKQALELIGSIGLRPVDVGPLPMARALESLAFLNIALNARNGWPFQSGWKLITPAAPVHPS